MGCPFCSTAPSASAARLQEILHQGSEINHAGRLQDMFLLDSTSACHPCQLLR